MASPTRAIKATLKSPHRGTPRLCPLNLLVSYQSHDHSVQVEEEHQQMETQFGKTLLLVLGQCSEDLGGVQQVVFLDELVDVVSEHWQVQQKHKPVAIEQEKQGQKAVQATLWNEPRVQFVAQLDWVDVVTLQVGVHNGEKDLREQVDGIDNHRKNK